MEDVKAHECPALCRNKAHGLFVVPKVACDECDTSTASARPFREWEESQRGDD